MNKSDFNLIEEQWIPVAQIGLVSLRDIFSNPDLPALGGSVLEKIAVMKLLLAIAQASYTPRDNKDWLELGISGLKEKCLSYLEQQKPYFSLYGEHPFLQFTQVKKAEIKPYSILFPEIASGNTSLLFHSQVAPAITDLDDAKKALALLVQMSSCFSGKKLMRLSFFLLDIRKVKVQNPVQLFVLLGFCIRFLQEKIFLTQFGLIS